MSTGRNPVSRPLAVIALGNPGMGDDGAGMAVAELLARCGRTGARHGDARIVAAGSDATAVAAALAEGEEVLVVDAVDMGRRPGEWRLFSAGQILPAPVERRASTHSLSLASVVELARALGCADRLRVLGIQAGPMAPGSGLSPGVRACLPGVLRRIRREAEVLT
jgi:hydrogenase maturation protease